MGLTSKTFILVQDRIKKSWLVYNHGLTERRDVEEEKKQQQQPEVLKNVSEETPNRLKVKQDGAQDPSLHSTPELHPQSLNVLLLIRNSHYQNCRLIQFSNCHYKSPQGSKLNKAGLLTNTNKLQRTITDIHKH